MIPIASRFDGRARPLIHRRTSAPSRAYLSFTVIIWYHVLAKQVAAVKNSVEFASYLARELVVLRAWLRAIAATRHTGFSGVRQAG